MENNKKQSPHQNQIRQIPGPPQINTRPLPPSYTYNRLLPKYIYYNPNQLNMNYRNQQTSQNIRLPYLNNPNPQQNLQEPFILNQSLPTEAEVIRNKEGKPYRNEDYILDMEKLYKSLQPKKKWVKINLKNTNEEPFSDIRRKSSMDKSNNDSSELLIGMEKSFVIIYLSDLLIN